MLGTGLLEGGGMKSFGWGEDDFVEKISMTKREWVGGRFDEEKRRTKGIEEFVGL